MAAFRSLPLYHMAQGYNERSGTMRRTALALMRSGGRAAKERQKGAVEMHANISNKVRKSIYRRDGFRCALCDSTDHLEIHHVVPRGKGGSRENPMNLITLCWRCHLAAHGSIYQIDSYVFTAPGNDMDLEERVAAMQEYIEQECVKYVSDLYAEQGEIWYPF